MKINQPYLLFLGDAKDDLAAKTAIGIHDWVAGSCVGQLRLPGCATKLDLPELSIEQAKTAGAKTLVIGVTNAGGTIPDHWLQVLQSALRQGLDIANGMHQRLSDLPELKQLAIDLNRQLIDVRHPTQRFSVGNGKLRSGNRLLTVGTDCSVGKMYTSLAIVREMKQRKVNCDFRATGQTGILIAGSGVPVDAVVADFISGSVESITPPAADDHWDIIEGQGSLFHPSFAGVSLGLIHGAQPAMLVLCHEPTRQFMRGLPHQFLPALDDCIEANLDAARLVSPHVKMAGFAINTRALSDTDARTYIKKIGDDFSLPCVDPYRYGTKDLVDFILHGST